MVIDLRSIRDGCAVRSAVTRMGYFLALLLFSAATLCHGIEPGFYGISDDPVGIYHEPSVALRAGKEHFGSSRRARWFGL